MNNLYQVDAFTEVPFKGNPAGVMVVDKFPETEWMQNIALEMNLSETAFIQPENGNFRIRYFTPIREVPLCGHATLASAHILFELGIVAKGETIHFRAEGADLTIHKEGEWITMIFPRYPLHKIAINGMFKSTVGFEPLEMYSSLYGWVIAVAAAEEEIAAARPDFEALKTNGLGHLMITAESMQEKTDFVLRCFAPLAGINEDPVTGSAHCALTPLWCEKTGKTELNSLQLSKRSGRLKTKLVNEKVEISGKSVTVFRLELKV
jgi:PhzF family phenazine biosynthesis protein